jgi:AcrR family transcriptional regulator
MVDRRERVRVWLGRYGAVTVGWRPMTNIGGLVERSGAGDAVRTLELLWRSAEERAPARGPQPRHSVDDLVVTAVNLADTDGLEAVSMRRLAGELGMAPMSVYTYVPGKAELLDLMLDRVYLDLPRPRFDHGTWREHATEVAHLNWAMYQAHPWMVDVVTARPPLGPGLLDKYEHELRAFVGLGLDDVTLDDTLQYLLSFVAAAARTSIHVRAGTEAAGSDAQWWAETEPLLAQAFDPAAYPLAVRIGTAAGQAHGSALDPEHAFRFGLHRTLDGIAALIEPPGSGS